MTSSTVLPAETGTRETLWNRRRRLVSLEIERIALAQFGAHGYEKVTIEQIANAAGITVRTFYRYFANKEDVLLALPRRVNARMIEAIRKRPPSESLIESCRQVIAAKADATRDDEEIALLWREILRHADQLPQIGGHPQEIDAMASLVADRLGVKKDSDPRPRVVAAAIAGAIGAGLARWYASGGSLDRSALLIEALDILEAIGALNAPARIVQPKKAKHRS